MKVSQEPITDLDEFAKEEHRKAMDGCSGMFFSLFSMAILWILLGVWLWMRN
jgi:hypothetical protein